MKYSPIALAVGLPLLAACGGGSTSAVPRTISVDPQSDVRADALSEVAPPLLSAGPNDRLYVSNAGNNSITVYLHSARGNTAPMFVIAGSKTQINDPGQLAEDAQGNLYVANSGPSDPAILVFAHGANGNVAPIRKLAGSATGITGVQAMTVDQTSGDIFVVDNGAGAGYSSTLERFAANATGNQAPLASGVIDFWAHQIASDSSGSNLIVGHGPECCMAASAGVETVAKRFAKGTPPASPYGIGGLTANGVADDPTTKTYLVASGTQGIYRLAERTTGTGLLFGGGLDLTPAPISTITSDTCASQLAVAPGPAPYMYVLHQKSYGCSDAVYVYANNANGNAAPLRVLSGPATKMNEPDGLTEGY